MEAEHLELQSMEQQNAQDTTGQNLSQTESSSETYQAQEHSAQQNKGAAESTGIRNLRTAKERLEFENRELQSRLKRLEEEQHKSKYDPDDLVERRYVDEQLEKHRKELQQVSTEYKLKSNYPDFDKVVNESTIAKLKEKNPTIAMAIGQVPDAYSQAAAAYETIRSMGLYNEDVYSAEKQKVQENVNKPRPVQSLNSQKGESHYGVADVPSFIQDPAEERKKIWREMQYYMKQPS